MGYNDEFTVYKCNQLHAGSVLSMKNQENCSVKCAQLTLIELYLRAINTQCNQDANSSLIEMYEYPERN